MKKMLLLIILALSFSAVSQTVYQLDHVHKYIVQSNDWFRNIEEYYNYDNGGTKETGILNKTSVDGINFQDNFRHTKSYNNNNSILLDKKQLWNGSVWLDNTRISKMYDGSDRLLQELKELDNGSGWENKTKYDYIYNDSENKSEILYYDKYEANAWVLYRQTFNSLTATGTEQEVWIRSIISGVLEPDRKSIATITNNLYMGEIVLTWDETLTVPDWVNDEKLEVSYTVNDEWDKFEYFNWDKNTNDWEPEPYQRTSYIRDDATYDLIILVEDNGAGGWINSGRLLYNTDGNGNLLSTSTESWDDSGGIWFRFSTATYEYDVNDNNTKITNQRDLGSGLENYFRTDKFWVEGTALSVTFNSLMSVHPYPNPTTDAINIKFKSPLAYTSEVYLYDIQGKLIHNTTIEKGSSTFRMPITYQTNGIYMLHIKTSESTEVYKIIKNNK